MIIDGKQIASELRETIRGHMISLPHRPTMGIVIVGQDPVIESFVRVKKKFGEAIGATVVEFRFDTTISGEELKKKVLSLSQRNDIDGIVIQLPLPVHIETQEVLDVVPVAKDVDVLSREGVAKFARGEAKIFPPVASAVQEILERHNVDVVGREVLILGYGRLVGKPVSILLRHNHAHVTVIDKPVSDLGTHVHDADIIVSGVGLPMLITKEMIKENAVLIDAGTSESGGKISGDVDPACAQIAKLFTPVPGGVGPIAIAMLFKNLFILTYAQHSVK